ncbi:hypothetical protein AO942_15865 [Pseudomonas aeruginosa]|nr:hypothetical protein AO942_15865 [Pseudomonas aeruginosa]OKR77636.1 hypothetical protein BH599_04410 [Pseudomonas aeruginosa]RPM50008.1 hypothetical protein IPC1291_04085 [Pseudomonas aeruginosa]
MFIGSIKMHERSCMFLQMFVVYATRKLGKEALIKLSISKPYSIYLLLIVRQSHAFFKFI